jgi:hypothetical protein
VTRKLTNLVIDRVDLVDKGANPDALITLAKRAPSRARATRPVASAPSTPTTWEEYVRKYPDAAIRSADPVVHTVDAVWSEIEEGAARRGGFAKAAAVPDRELPKLVDDFIQTDAGRVLYRRYVEATAAVTKRATRTVLQALEAAGVEPRPYDPATDRVPRS